MNKAKVAPKAAQKKASEETDPAYIGLLLRGLARLVLCASGSSGHADPIDDEAGFFISETLEEMAGRLGAQ